MQIWIHGIVPIFNSKSTSLNKKKMHKLVWHRDTFESGNELRHLHRIDVRVSGVYSGGSSKLEKNNTTIRNTICQTWAIPSFVDYILEVLGLMELRMIVRNWPAGEEGKHIQEVGLSARVVQVGTLRFLQIVNLKAKVSAQETPAVACLYVSSKSAKEDIAKIDCKIVKEVHKQKK